MVKNIKKELKTLRGQVVLAIVICAVTLLGWLAMGRQTAGATTQPNIRDIVLEIRSMTFGDNNPTIYIDPRETVRFIIHNLDQGMEHNFNIKGTNISTRLLKYGEKETVVFQQPTVGEWIYFCTPHAPMMNGRIVVGRI